MSEPVRKTSALAIWSLVLGLLGFLWFPALLGLILGITALVKIRRAKGQLSGTGLAVAGVTLSGSALILAPLLAGLILPAVVRAQEQAKAEKAQAQAMEIRAALLAYFDEYGHPPVVRDAAATADVQTSTAGGLLAILHGRQRDLNPRGKVFLANPEADRLDPWGRPFQILLDGNADGRVALPAGEGGASRTLQARVVVWSLGPDGQPEGGARARDDILAY